MKAALRMWPRGTVQPSLEIVGFVTVLEHMPSVWVMLLSTLAEMTLSRAHTHAHPAALA